MSQSYAPTQTQTPEQEQSSDSAQKSNFGLGYYSGSQCALEDGCEGVPPLDDLFWEGFSDEHGDLIGDLTEVTGRAMELQPMLAPEAAGTLDYHIDGCFALDELLAQQISDAQISAYYEEDESVVCDEAAVDSAMITWDRLEVALDILREYNGAYAAIGGADLLKLLAMIASTAADLLDRGIERSMEANAIEAQEKLRAFEAAWKLVVPSLKKVPLNVAADMATGLVVEAAIPVILGGLGIAGGATLPAIAVATGVVFAAGMITDRVTDGWAPDLEGFTKDISELNGHLDFSADISAIDQVGAGFKTAADNVGKVSTGITVLTDLAAAGVAIDGVLQAAAAWKAFQEKQDMLQKSWAYLNLLMQNFLKFAAEIRAATQMLDVILRQHVAVIRSLEAHYGGGLYP